MTDAGSLNEYGPLRRVALRRPRDSFGSAEKIAQQWQGLNYTSPPDLSAAEAEFAALVAKLESVGTTVEFLPEAPGLTLDSIYVRDAALQGPDGGIILCNMGKPARMGEPKIHGQALERAGFPLLGAIEGQGRIEGGDVIWLDETSLAVAHGYRTNAAGIRQLKSILGPKIEVQIVPLPHYKGPGDVFHLMSIISPLDRDLALVYSPLMPVPFREWLIQRGIVLVEVPDAEFDSMGCNVLAIAPRHCLMLKNNPVTQARLIAAGCKVEILAGDEISQKGQGGPTCLTRPLLRG